MVGGVNASEAQQHIIPHGKKKQKKRVERILE